MYNSTTVADKVVLPFAAVERFALHAISLSEFLRIMFLVSWTVDFFCTNVPISISFSAHRFMRCLGHSLVCGVQVIMYLDFQCLCILLLCGLTESDL